MVAIPEGGEAYFVPDPNQTADVTAGVADSPIAEAVRDSLGRLTPAERKPALLLLANYPVAGLETVAQFASRAQVSGPTVLRLIGKLGFTSYPEFQQRLREELELRLQPPLAKAARRQQSGRTAPDFLLSYGQAIVTNIQQSLHEVARSEFDAVVDLLAGDARRVLLLGGRFTHSLALQLHLHLREMRAGVELISGQTEGWAEHLLDMNRHDALIVFDIRRYQDDVIRFAQQAAQRGVRVILFTDHWLSPIAAVARHVIAVRTTAPSVWDSSVALSTVAEALVARLQERRWEDVEQRITALERLRSNLKDAPGDGGGRG